MKTACLIAPFDPVLNTELDYAKTWRKEQGLDRVYLVCSEEGVLSKEKRFAYLTRACRPFDRLVPITFEQWKLMNGPTEEIPDALQQEESARNGQYRKCPACVRQSILKEPVYLNALVHACCSEKRASHSIAVAETARTIAQAHGVDIDLAWQAGMLHDITKNWTSEESRKLLSVYNPEALQYAEPIWHSMTAPIYLKQVCGLLDHRILHAVFHHTLGTGKTNLDRILYIADKIEPTRGYDVTKQMALACTDLVKCTQVVIAQAEEYRKEKENKNV